MFKVLLIDDEPGAIEGMQMWIHWQELGFEVCGTCNNGMEGLRMIQDLEPDLVVTDVNMPLMDGLMMIEAWQKVESKPVRFAILSGYSEFEYAQRSMRFGVNHYLLKPVIPEEAEEELREIHQELLDASMQQSLTRIASYEEVVSLIKKLLNKQLIEESDHSLLSKLSADKEEWNFCLIQTEPSSFADLRGKAASVLEQEERAYLVDLEMNSFGIVYGYDGSANGEGSSCRIMQKLKHLYSPYRVLSATGAGESTLLRIERCYHTAKEAISYQFYDQADHSMVSSKSIRNKPFHYHYDQMQLMEGMIAAITLLDKSGFQKAVESAARSFREMLIAPEIVNKVAIHMLYRIIEIVREASEVQAESLIGKYRLSRNSGSLLTLNDVMGDLLSCGEECIDWLLSEQLKQSQGIIHAINSYIREHFAECLSIKKLAEVFYLHPVYLGQLLMKKNGISFHELLHDLRVEEAVRLLGENRLKNSEIAEQVGYSHYSQFLKQFEARKHMSPNEYKKTMF